VFQAKPETSSKLQGLILAACVPGHVKAGKGIVRAGEWTLALQHASDGEVLLATPLTALRERSLFAQLLC